ncbi:hypothetical protein AGMMS50262_03260 [Bacteroidia bacterium]|nr:hypothetical protein AGMMS50262_03260 [Bacteroidia bacterium]
MIIRGEERYKAGLKAMWKLCFPADTERFISFYFDEIYKNNETLLYLIDDKPVASLQMIPYPVKTGNRIQLGGYLSGVMTHPDFRKRGYMSELLTVSFDEMEKKGYAYTFLIPQNEELFDLYAKYGYIEAFPEQKTTYPSKKTVLNYPVILRDKQVRIYSSLESVDLDDFYTLYYRFLLEKPAAVLKTKPQLSVVLWDFFDEKGILFANDWGFAFTFAEVGEIFVKECYFCDDEMEETFFNVVREYYQLEKIAVFNDKKAPFLRYKGMIKSLNSVGVPPTELYMSMMSE